MGTARRHGGRVTVLALSNTAHRLVTASADRWLTVWAVEAPTGDARSEGEELAVVVRVRAPGPQINALSFIDDDRVLIGHADGAVGVVGVADGLSEVTIATVPGPARESRCRWMLAPLSCGPRGARTSRGWYCRRCPPPMSGEVARS